MTRVDEPDLMLGDTARRECGANALDVENPAMESIDEIANDSFMLIVCV
jgi:hypothetical protein